MELDYKELQAISEVRKRLKYQRLLPNERRIAWAVAPLIIVSQLLANHDHHGLYYAVLVVCLIAWAVLFSVTEAINQRRHTQQMRALLGIAQRVMDGDDINRQKLNELRILNTAR